MIRLTRLSHMPRSFSRRSDMSECERVICCKLGNKCKYEFTVREMVPGDEALINEFFDSMGGAARAVFNRRDYNRRGALRYCTKPDGTRMYYLFILDGKIAGYVFFLNYNTGIPELGMAVRDELSGIGLGKVIGEFAITLAKEAGVGGLYLTTHVANTRAQALYEYLGFRLIGPTKSGTEFAYLLNFAK